MISGGPKRSSASLNASRQKRASMLFDNRQASRRRLYTSMMPTR